MKKRKLKEKSQKFIFFFFPFYGNTAIELMSKLHFKRSSSLSNYTERK